MEVTSILSQTQIILSCQTTIDFLQNPSFLDHFKRRSENTKHTFGNNWDLNLDSGG